jgi:hypothetical protein
MFVTAHQKSGLIVPNQKLSTSQATLANLFFCGIHFGAPWVQNFM